MLGVMVHMDYVTESPALLQKVNYRKSAINGLLLFLSVFPWSRSNRKQMHIYTNEWEEFLLTYLVGMHPVAGIPKKWKFVFYMPDTVYFYSFIFLYFMLTCTYAHHCNFIWKTTTHTLHKIWSFPLRIYSVNVTKPSISCGSCHIYWRNP